MKIEIKDVIRCFIVKQNYHCLVYVVCPDHIDDYVFLSDVSFDFHFEEKIQKKIRKIYGDDVKFEKSNFKQIIRPE